MPPHFIFGSTYQVHLVFGISITWNTLYLKDLVHFLRGMPFLFQQLGIFLLGIPFMFEQLGIFLYVLTICSFPQRRQYSATWTMKRFSKR